MSVRTLSVTILCFLVMGHVSAASAGEMWISASDLAALPRSGPAWESLKSAADSSAGTPDLTDQDESTNVYVMAKALMFAATHEQTYFDGVAAALQTIVNSGTYSGRALAIGRKLAAYVVAADLVDLKINDPSLDASFRAKLAELYRTPTDGGPENLVACHETRPNNWGTACGGSRLAVALYLGDDAEVARIADVFHGWLGDRSAYSGFDFKDLDWQADPANPVGINAAGATIDGHNVDGALPEELRRSGGFTWPPPAENYIYTALQGALMQAVLLSRAGYDVWNWEDQALRRAFTWLNTEADFPAQGNDECLPHVINHFYGTSFAAAVPSEPGKTMAWTEWTFPAGDDNPGPGPGPDPGPGPGPDPGPSPACDLALPTLKAAVGIGSCELALCDADGDGSITTFDALAFLQECVAS